MYGRESITTVFIISTLKTKEMELLATKKEQPTVEGLFVKRKAKMVTQKTIQQPNEDNKGKQKIRCNYCEKEDHILKYCYINNPRETSILVIFLDALVSTNEKANLVSPFRKHDWVLDLGCTFHMSPPFKPWFNTYKRDSWRIDLHVK